MATAKVDVAVDDPTAEAEADVTVEDTAGQKPKSMKGACPECFPDGVDPRAEAVGCAHGQANI